MSIKCLLVLAGVMLMASMNTWAFSLEYRPIYFPEGRPFEGESSIDLTAILDAGQIEVIKELLLALKERPDLGGEVEGFSDGTECSTAEACMDLSFRRAIIVFEWLRKNGLRPQQLRGPRGLSTEFTNYHDPAERHFNRRVNLAPYVLMEHK